MFVCSSVWEDVTLTGAGLAILFAMLAVMVITVVAVNAVPRLVHKWEIAYTTRDLTYGAACLALAFALSWAGVTLPNGGTITVASLVPIFIYCYYFGFRKGIVVTAAYTLLQFVQFPNIVSPWSAFFDYILPYFSLCVAGLFCYKPQKYAAFIKRDKTDGARGAKSSVKKWAFTVGGHWGIFAGAIAHMIIRYFCQTVSGIMNFELWYGDGFSFGYKLGFSLGYNAYGLLDSAITVAALCILLSSRSFNMFMTATFDDKSALKTAAAGEACAVADATTVADNTVEADLPAAAQAAERAAAQSGAETLP